MVSGLMVSLAYTKGLFCAFFWLCQMPEQAPGGPFRVFSHAWKEENHMTISMPVSHALRATAIFLPAFSLGER